MIYKTHIRKERNHSQIFIYINVLRQNYFFNFSKSFQTIMSIIRRVYHST